jgi:hypothetical protein
MIQACLGPFEIAEFGKRAGVVDDGIARCSEKL